VVQFLGISIPVKKIYEELKQRGFDPWMDVFDIPGGMLWEEAIETAIDEADFFLICISKNSVGRRGYYRREISRARKLCEEKLADDIYLIPLRLESVLIRDRGLERYQWIDYYGEGGPDKLLFALNLGGRKYLYS
jgi:hypothetical protein